MLNIVIYLTKLYDNFWPKIRNINVKLWVHLESKHL